MTHTKLSPLVKRFGCASVASHASALLAAFALSITSASARSFWLLPSETVFAAAGEWVTVDGGASTAPFENSKFPLELAELRITAPDGSAVAPQNALTGKLRSVFDVHLEQRGTYRLVVLDDSAFALWKDAKNGGQGDRATGVQGIRAAEEERRWRGAESELKNAVPADAQDLKIGQMLYRTEVFITVGEPGPIPAAPSGHAGIGLEMVPLTHPSDLVPDEEAEFAFFINGEPAAELTVTVTPGGFRWRDDAGVIELKTDAEGRVRVTWPGPGQYLIYAATSDDKATVSGAAERLIFYAGTLEVLP